MRVLISGGGTGGHVYPALAVAALLKWEPPADSDPDVPPNGQKPVNAQHSQPYHRSGHEVVWVGSAGGMEEELVERAGIDYRGVNTGQLRGKNPVTAARNAGKMLTGIRQSGGIIAENRPDVCLVTGGYVCAPMVVACRATWCACTHISAGHGAGIRWLSRIAQRVAVTLPDAAAHFGGSVDVGGKAVVTGYPVRPELVAAAADRRTARLRLAELLNRPSLAPGRSASLDDNEWSNAEDLPLLLVWGGSQGSCSINQATWDSLPHLLTNMHVVHVVGVRDWEMAQPILDAKRMAPEWQPAWSSRYHAVDYLHEGMPWALAAADLTLARAGASILGEFPVAGLPSILVPLPIAGVGQQLNARALERRGAAIVVADDDLGAQLAPTVNALFQDGERLRAMEAEARSLANPDAAQNIVNELAHLAADGGDGSPTEDPPPTNRTEA